MSSSFIFYKNCIFLSPDHVVPGVQNLVVGQPGGRSDNLREQQPGSSWVIRFSVWDQVVDERRCKLLLFGPDGKGPAEILAGHTGTISETAAENVLPNKKAIWKSATIFSNNYLFGCVLIWYETRQNGVCPTSGSGTRDRAGPAGPRSASDWHPGGGWQSTT